MLLYAIRFVHFIRLLHCNSYAKQINDRNVIYEELMQWVFGYKLNRTFNYTGNKWTEWIGNNISSFLDKKTTTFVLYNNKYI